MKRKMKIAQIVSLSLVCALIVSCKEKTIEPTQQTQTNPTPTSCNVVQVTQGTISSPTTWTTGNVYYVTSPVVVTSVLTIQPGVIVKFNGDGQLRVNGSGVINAIGTASKHITLTSFKDDLACGDSNGDGVATTPQKGDWYGIYLNGGNNTFEYCDVLYAGKNDGGYYYSVLISVSGYNFKFNNCTFAHTLSNASSSAAYAFYGGQYMSDPTVSVFTNNAFYDNDRPLNCSFNYTVNPNNIFHNPNNVNETNSRNGIFMWGGIGENVSYNVKEVPYVLLSDFSGGGSGAVRNINIGNDVVLKFTNSNWGIARGNNNHINLGTGVVFTSYKDDVHGGDTNGDGSSTSPSAGDWIGFWNYSNNTYVSGSYIYYAAN